MEKKPKVAINVFIIRDNKLLLGKRKNTAGDGFWGLPGGHLEYMESLVEGAKRELEEETGLKIEKLIFSNLTNDLSPENDGTHYVHVNFIAEGVRGEPELREPERCYEWKWFEADNLPDNIFHGHRKLILAFRNKEVFSD